MTKLTLTAADSTCVIKAQDFSLLTTDHDRDIWTAGKMRHTLAAIGDTPVIITTDKQTGHTCVNVTLTGLQTNPYGGGYQVAVTSTYPDGKTYTVWHSLLSIGATIVPLTATNAKWTAVRSYRDEASYAVELAQLQHGKPAGREWGNWDSRVGFTEVSVTYTPYPSTYADVAPRGDRGFWTYKLEECAAQGKMRQQYMHDRYPGNYEAPARQSSVCSNAWHRGMFDFMTCSECPKG